LLNFIWALEDEDECEPKSVQEAVKVVVELNYVERRELRRVGSSDEGNRA
jgi:hypothetical protein